MGRRWYYKHTKRHLSRPHHHKWHRPRKIKRYGRIVTVVIILVLALLVYVNRDSIKEASAQFYNSYLKSSGQDYVCSEIQYVYSSSEEEAREILDYVNQKRGLNGRSEISFDERVFELAVARAKDMHNYSYLDHTNPYTKSCPDNMKSDFGLKAYEYVAENVYGSPEFLGDSCTRDRPLTDAVDSWMTSKGHRYNLLYEGHTAGAVGCYKNMCVFLGLNRDRFGDGCHTAAEGEEYWRTH